MLFEITKKTNLRRKGEGRMMGFHRSMIELYQSWALQKLAKENLEYEKYMMLWVTVGDFFWVCGGAVWREILLFGRLTLHFKGIFDFYNLKVGGSHFFPYNEKQKKQLLLLLLLLLSLLLLLIKLLLCYSTLITFALIERN